MTLEYILGNIVLIIIGSIFVWRIYRFLGSDSKSKTNRAKMFSYLLVLEIGRVSYRVIVKELAAYNLYLLAVVFIFTFMSYLEYFLLKKNNLL